MCRTASLTSIYILISTAFETSSALYTKALESFVDLGRRIAVNSNDNRGIIFLFWRLSVLIQRFDAVAFWGSFADDSKRYSLSVFI